MCHALASFFYVLFSSGGMNFSPFAARQWLERRVRARFFLPPSPCLNNKKNCVSTKWMITVAPNVELFLLSEKNGRWWRRRGFVGIGRAWSWCVQRGWNWISDTVSGRGGISYFGNETSKWTVKSVRLRVLPDCVSRLTASPINKLTAEHAAGIMFRSMFASEFISFAGNKKIRVWRGARTMSDGSEAHQLHVTWRTLWSEKIIHHHA